LQNNLINYLEQAFKSVISWTVDCGVQLPGIEHDIFSATGLFSLPLSSQIIRLYSNPDHYYMIERELAVGN
jgi:hypothetical protein